MGENKKIISQEDIMKMLDGLYDKSYNGIKYVSPSVDDMANDYLSKSSNPEEATKKMLNNQIVKCATSGFLTGFGGAITLPVTIPANVGSVLYVQMRMIACTAKMAGYDLETDQVQTLVYACLAGVSVNEVIKKAGVQFGMKFAKASIQKISGSTLVKINQKVGFRFLTKFGEKGIVNLGKLVPGVGAVINGGLDYAETKVIANRAYKWFFEGDFSEDKDTDKNIIDVDEEEIIDINVYEDTDSDSQDYSLTVNEIANKSEDEVKKSINFDSIKNGSINALNAMKSGISSGLNSAKDSVDSVANELKKNIDKNK